MSVSKYFLNKRAEEFECHIRNTSDWPFIMKDPVFIAISIECEMVSMLELISRRDRLFESHRVKTPVQSARSSPEAPGLKDENQDRSDRSAEPYREESRGSMSPSLKGRMEQQDANGEEHSGSVKGPKSDEEEKSVPMEAKIETRSGSQKSQTPDQAQM